MAKDHLGFLPQCATQIAIELYGGAIAATSPEVLNNFLALGFFLRIQLSFIAELLQALPRSPHFPLLSGVPGENCACIDVDSGDIPNLQPLPDKVLDQRIGARIFQHALNLGSEALPQFSAFGERPEFVIGHGGPKEIGKPGG
jgi:hypothetical protein